MLILRPLICPPKLVSLIRFWVVWMYVNKVSAASGASEHIVCGVSIDGSLHGGSNDTIGGRVRHRRPEKSPVWFGCMSIRCQRPQGPLSIVCGVSIDASLHGGSNDTIGSRVRHRRPEILRFLIRLCPPLKAETGGFHQRGAGRTGF